MTTNLRTVVKQLNVTFPVLRWALAVVVSLVAADAFALTTATWTGGAGNWTDPTNWNSNPFYANNGQNGDTWNAVLNNGATVTLDGAITIQALTFSGSGGTIANSGNTLTTNGLVTFGPISGAGNLSRLTGTGTLDAVGGVAFRADGGLNPPTRNSWTINLKANSDFISGNGWVMDNTGTINIESGVTFDHIGNNLSGGGIQGAGVINNEGIYQRVTHGTLISIGNQFNNKLGGQVKVVSGNLTLSGGGTQDGGFDISAGRTLSLAASSFTINPTASFTGGGHLTVSTFTFQNGSSIDIGGNLTINGIPTFNSAVTTLVGGNLSLPCSSCGFGGAGDIVVQGKFLWNAIGGNALTGAGKLTFMNGMEAFNDSGADSNVKTIDLHGTSFLDANGGSATMNNTGTINIKSGSFDYRSRTNATSARLLGAGTINNEGLFFRSETSIAGRIDNTFNNLGGTLRADAGTELNFMGAAFSQTAGTTLIDGGAISIAGTAHFTGGTIVGGNGGALTANVISTNPGTGLTISPGTSAGTLDINGNVTLDGNDKIVIEMFTGASHDVLNVSGALDLGGSTLDLTFFDSFSADPSDTFVIISAGTLTGTFGNAPAGTYAAGKYIFTLDYAGGDVILSNVFAVPEPSTLLLVGLGVVGLGGRRLGRARWSRN